MLTVIVTGSNRGIGLEYAKQYAKDGARVYACCRRPEKAGELLALAQANSDRVTVHPLEVTNDGQIAALKAVVGDAPVDILINNAGVYGADDQDLGACDESKWLETFRINTIAPYKMIATFADNVARSRKKTIVGMTSKMGSMDDNSSGGYYIYRSSKAALNAVLKSAAVDLQPREIIVLTLHPGWVKTAMGGPGALITTTRSVTNLRKIIDNATVADSGKFFQHDGAEVPW